MTDRRFRVYWLGFRTLQTRVKVVAHTPSGEPVVRAGADRLILRTGTRTFWTAATCPSCRAEMATADLGSHRCTRGVPVSDPAMPAAVAPARPSGGLEAGDLAPSTPAIRAPMPPVDHRRRSVTKRQRQDARAVAQRTFGQRPWIVGLDPDGAVIVRINRVRLLLPPGARHFRTVAQCAFCGGGTTARIMDRDDIFDTQQRICHPCLGELGGSDGAPHRPPTVGNEDGLGPDRRVGAAPMPAAGE